MSEKEEPKEAEEILDEQIRTSFREYERSNQGTFLSAFTAGLEIGFSVFLMGVLYVYWKDLVPQNALHLIVSTGYPIGFMFVIIGRSELFTEHTSLAILPVLNGEKSLKELLALWGLVITGNLIGGTLFAFFISWIGPEMGVISHEALLHMAANMLEPRWELLLGSAVLAGWLMGLLSWLASSSQDSISRISIVIMVTVIIGLGKLHHCIVGSVEVLAGLFVSDTISIGNYLHFLLFAIIGNTLGGALFVAILKYSQLKIHSGKVKTR